MLLKIILNFVLLAVVIQVALACNGYKLKVLKLENCGGPDAVVTIDPAFSLKLNEDCEMVATGCVTNKAFNTAMGTYKVVKDGSVYREGQIDMCYIAERVPGEMHKLFEPLGAPSSCPVEKREICSNDNKYNISKYKRFLGMAAGLIVIDVTFEYDTGKSCMHMELEFGK